LALAKARSRNGSGRVIAYVADADEPTLHTIDVDAHNEIAATRLKGRPEQVLVLADGRVAVTLRSSNAVEVLEPAPQENAPLASRCVVDTPAEPIALASTPDDTTVVVTSGWGHALSAFDAHNFAPKFEVKVARDPRSVVVSDDGARAFVAHVVEARMSVVDLLTSEHAVRLVDLRARTVQDQDGELALRKGCQGFAVTQVEYRNDASGAKMVGRVFAPMVSVNSGEAGSESSGYGSDSPTEISEVAVVDASAERPLTRMVRLPTSGTATTECLLPRAAAYDDGALYLTCLGIDSMVKLDARSLDPARAELRRWKLAAGPTGVAIDHQGKRAVVWSQFDREVSFVATESDDAPARLAVARQSAGLTANVALGRKLFHQMGDSRISADGRACASCHPDGREDALTWSTPDGARQTPMLAGRVAETAPYGWSGSSDKLQDHLKKTFERLSGEGLPSADVLALIDYVSSMAPPIERAVPKEPERQKLVERGHALFESAETACSSCHDANQAFTDGLKHQVMAQPPAGHAEGFDTPSLRFVAGTAPYFHDGRYKTLEEVLIAPDHAMGESTRMSRQDRAALVAYLETL
jgi:cytochrome c peroxidase